MIAELGFFALILALMTLFMLVLIPSFGLALKRTDWIESANTYLALQFIFITLAYLCLSLSFLQDDFSLIYVFNNSSRLLPWFYKLCAVWGGHEGSMLLWIAVLSFWMVLVGIFSNKKNPEMRTRVLVVLALLNIGFLLFLLTTSNPFIRQLIPSGLQGRDLNPLLQDIGFLFHPPMLYMGYVGFSVAFAFAIAALWQGQVEISWAKWARPWTLAAWCCLTLGITLGSWWAYRELGWGGWWFWDPVENASFMPWLVGTALIHSLAVTEQRQHFKAWTLLLAITAFSLSLIGTFLVRSGVLTSVHAFAVDPQRGLAILVFLFLVIGGSLLLFLLKAHRLQSSQRLELCSRESGLLLNNVLLVVMMLTVLMGTIYPLFIEGLHLGKLSVGAPYFNTVFVPLMIPLLFLMGIGIHLRWRTDSWHALFKRINKMAILSIFCPLLLLMGTQSAVKISALLGLSLAFWVLLSTFKCMVHQVKERGFFAIRQSYWGMCLAHCGVALAVIGVTLSSNYGANDDVVMSIGKKIHWQGYGFELIKQMPLNGPNYQGTKAVVKISKLGREKIIYPEKRQYLVSQMAMTDAAIDVTAFRDIYIALGEPLNAHSWSVRLYYKPFVRWIWGGGFMIFLGGLIALSDRRYYQRAKSSTTETVRKTIQGEVKI